MQLNGIKQNKTENIYQIQNYSNISGYNWESGSIFKCEPSLVIVQLK